MRSVLPSALTAAVVFLLIEFWLVAKRVPLGHDESVYLLRARDFAGFRAAGDGYWAPYRAPGLPALLSIPMRLFGESISISRSIVALLGAACVVGIAWLVGRLAGTIAGAIAPWIVVMTSAFTSYASLVLLDVPGTLLVVIAALLIERATRYGRVDWWPAVLLPVVFVAAVYVRFGATTNLAAAMLAVLVPRADHLLAVGRRVESIRRLVVVGVASAGGAAAVLIVPALTGSRTSPLRIQRVRQDAKGLSTWASYGDTFDLFWPNGSRSGEAVTWLALSVLVAGAILTLIAALRGRHRRAALAGVVGFVAWIVGLNYALAQMFGNYLGLGVPFFALLAAPGWAYAYELVGSTQSRRAAAWALACAVAVVGCTQAMVAASDQVESQKTMQELRTVGGRIDQIAPNGRCGILTSYVQVAWYADCAISNFSIARIGYYADHDPAERGVFDLDETDGDQIYLVLLERGKRQPKGEDLERLLADAELVVDFPDLVPPVTVYRLVVLDRRTL